MPPKVLLTTVHQPLGVDNETCTTNIQAEVYHAQITSRQGPFSIRGWCTGWGLDFIAENLQAPTTVLHYPTLRRLEKELRSQYDFIGIGFTICTFPKAREICRLVRASAPRTKIIMGGYGTVLQECDGYADYVCREEGVNFMKRLLGEEEVTTFRLPVIKRRLSVLSVSIGTSLIVPVGLGCSRGCEFCCTSHFFNRDYHPLVTSGKEIHDFIFSVDLGNGTYRDVGIIDEDFLMDYKRGMELAAWNVRELEKPIMFSCLTSLRSLSQYTTEDLISMGLAGVWVGVESKQATYGKLRGLDVSDRVARLKNAGINVLTSMIVGYDWHDERGIEDDFQYLLSLQPTLSQFMIYSPCPHTPLYEHLKRKNRLLSVPHKYHDGFHLLFKHPHFSPLQLERLIVRLCEREYEELGPSIFRVLETQLNGYEAWKDSSIPMFRRRALEHQRLCQRLYPLLGVGIGNAPSLQVGNYLKALRDRIEATMTVPYRERAKKFVAPLLYYYTRIRDTVMPYRQPPQQIHRYGFPSR